MEKKELNIIKEEVLSKLNSMDERKEYFAQKLEKCSNIKEDVMNIYHNIKSNGCKPIMVEKVTLDRILQKHGENGLIIVSANRADNTKEYNEMAARDLLANIENAGYSYLPAYGGYQNSKTGERGDYEPSYIIFNYSSKGEKRDFEKLKEFGIALCGRYNQDCITIKEPNKPAYWIDRNGEKVNSSETEKYWKNSPYHEYFTTLVSKDKAEELEKLYNKKYNGRKFTYDIIPEIYINPIPCTLNERIRREFVGEVMVWI